jgi:hypothetical protein
MALPVGRTAGFAAWLQQRLTPSSLPTVTGEALPTVQLAA